MTREQLDLARRRAFGLDSNALLILEDARAWVDRMGLVLWTPKTQLAAPAPVFVSAISGVAEPGVAEAEVAKPMLGRLVREGAAVPLLLLGGAAPGDIPDFVVSAAALPYLYTLRGDKNWKAAPAAQQQKWGGAYSDALASKAAGGNPAKVAAGDYGPVPVLTSSLLAMAQGGGLQAVIQGEGGFYNTDYTKSVLFLADGTYLEDHAVAEHLGGDQWGMMNETQSYPGQSWMWLYSFWYQIEPFKSSPNADALVWGIMMILSLGLLLVPFLPGIRSLPRWIPIHRLIWRDYYRAHPARRTEDGLEGYRPG